MSSAYVMPPPPPQVHLTRLPLRKTTHGGVTFILNRAAEEDLLQARALLNGALEDGDSYPFESPLDDAGFRSYFLSHDAFVARAAETTEVIGIFYVKPNFPGRCSHICNGGFVVAPAYRSRGVARAMGKEFIVLARELGYRAIMFNLVFVTNTASLRLWRSLGFTELGRLPNAGNLKGHGYTDAIQFYKDISEP